jgi:hypothetical protein
MAIGRLLPAVGGPLVVRGQLSGGLLRLRPLLRDSDRDDPRHPQEPKIHREACRRGVAFNDEADSSGDEIPDIINAR